ADHALAAEVEQVERRGRHSPRYVLVVAAETASATSRSASRSSGDSSPTESLTRFGGAANGDSAVDMWVINAGISIRLSTPPRLSASFQIFVRSTSATASSSDSARNEIMPPKSRIWREAISCPGWFGSPG